MVKTVKLSSLSQMREALQAYAEEAERAVVRGLRSASYYGEGQLFRASNSKMRTYRGIGGRTIRRKIRASGEYQGSFIRDDLSDGAFVANSAKHTVYVERGRSPGRAPPFSKILKWVKIKRFNHKRMVGVGPLAAGQSVKRIRWSKGEKQSIAADLDAKLARQYQRRIAKYGTRPSWIFRDTMPKIAKRAIRDVRSEMRKLNGDPPRKRRSSKKVKTSK